MENLTQFAPMSPEMGEITKEKYCYHSINTSAKSSSEILQIGTSFGTLESRSRISLLISSFFEDLFIPVMQIHNVNVFRTEKCDS